MKQPVRVERWRAVLLALAISFGTGVRPAAAATGVTIRVFAAASLSDAFRDIAHHFEHQYRDVSVQLNLAGSQQLVAQIEHGANADVFASADERWMGYARDHGLLAGSSTVFVRNRLVVIVPRSNPARIHTLQDLARGGVKFVTTTDAVPVGRYTRIVLEHVSKTRGFAPDFAARVLRNVVSEEENVRSIASKVQLGEADAGIVYRSDVTPALARYVRVLEIPAAANIMASYPIATVRTGAHPTEARAFVDLVRSAEGQHLLARWGFIPVSGAR